MRSHATLKALLPLVFTLGVTLTTGAFAKSKSPSRSESIGAPDRGHLLGGKELRETKHLRAVGSHRFGVVGLVHMLEKSADEVAKKFPNSLLFVGDLSKKGGGDVDGHRSHESGRDADVGFYLQKDGKPFVPARFPIIDETGSASGMPGVRFDVARNWRLVEAWLKSSDAAPLQIFIADHLKTRLIAEAMRAKSSPAIIARAKEVLLQPKRGMPHDNHFHVRIACPKGSASCSNYAAKKTQRPIVARRQPTSKRVKDKSASKR